MAPIFAHCGPLRGLLLAGTHSGKELASSFAHGKRVISFGLLRIRRCISPPAPFLPRPATLTCTLFGRYWLSTGLERRQLHEGGHRGGMAHPVRVESWEGYHPSHRGRAHLRDRCLVYLFVACVELCGTVGPVTVRPNFAWLLCMMCVLDRHGTF